ncbi:hypothetical protein EYF80_006845 [Liparis tanakae]|uniref:Uncharacterized protein n=1 Tax=Liparis tanakae TaxID=230148 RepID=A0A4Z2IZH1_9TELE|nr:hypothetical protein EYF80_006845 [Liparis tanakae]
MTSFTGTPATEITVPVTEESCFGCSNKIGLQLVSGRVSRRDGVRFDASALHGGDELVRDLGQHVFSQPRHAQHVVACASALTGMEKGCHTGFNVFFTTSVLWQMAELQLDCEDELRESQLLLSMLHVPELTTAKRKPLIHAEAVAISNDTWQIHHEGGEPTILLRTYPWVKEEEQERETRQEQ